MKLESDKQRRMGINQYEPFREIHWLGEGEACQKS